jgi:CRP-like cAMP-binding protein
MPRIASTEVITPRTLSPEERARLTESLYAVHQEIFDGVERESFAKYVVESTAEETWIQVHKDEAGRIVGYFALHLFERQWEGQPTAIFRAEAGSLRAWRGGGITLRFGLARVLRYRLQHPGRRMFYLGSLVHPSSYLLLARHCAEVWPRREQHTPHALQTLMDALATEFGLERVDPANPLVRRVGWRTRDSEVEQEYWRHCDRPEARYFLGRNPGYVEGHGLVTLVPLTAANLVHMARAVGARWLRQPLEATLALARRGPLGARLRRSTVVRQLRASPFFAHFDEDSLRAVAAHAEPVPLPAGRYVFHKGDASDELYLLARGAVYVLAHAGAEEKVVDELGSGSMFGEIAMITQERRSASIRTATTSTLVRIPRAALLPLIEANARLRQGLWQSLAERRFDDLTRNLERYGHLSRKQRRSWLQRGEYRELAPEETLTLEADAHLFMLAGTMELTHAEARATVHGSMLVEAESPLSVRARGPAWLILVPPEVEEATCCNGGPRRINS